jgi:hypothetical protein
MDLGLLEPVLLQPKLIQMVYQDMDNGLLVQLEHLSLPLSNNGGQ